MSKVKEITAKLMSNKKQLMIIIAIFLLNFIITAIWVAYRPGFLKIKPIPIVVADLTNEFRDYRQEDREWKQKKDIQDSIRDMKMEYIPIGPSISIENLSQVSSNYGVRRNADGTSEFHKAVDIRARKGTPVYAKGSGIVVNAKYNDGYGNQVVIRHMFGYITYYSHLDSIYVKSGQEIKQGVKIGTVGSTGNSTGNHLDLRITFLGLNVNPAVFAQL